MKAELKAKWIAALRSGDYQQARGVLRRAVTPGVFSFCCVGVFCEVIGATVKRDSNNNTRYHIDDVAIDMCELPVATAIGQSVGMDDETGIHRLQLLAAMNDDDGKSFAEIADYIDSNVPAEE